MKSQMVVCSVSMHKELGRVSVSMGSLCLVSCPLGPLITHFCNHEQKEVKMSYVAAGDSTCKNCKSICNQYKPLLYKSKDHSSSLYIKYLKMSQDEVWYIIAKQYHNTLDAD